MRSARPRYAAPESRRDPLHDCRLVREHGTRSAADHAGLDLVIDPPSAAEFEALLVSMPADKYYVDADTARDALRQRSMFNLVDLAAGWKVDLLLRNNREFSRDEFARRKNPRVQAPRKRRSSASASTISLGRAVARLFRMSALGPITGRVMPSSSTRTREAFASSNVTPLMEVSRSIRRGGSPI